VTDINAANRAPWQPCAAAGWSQRPLKRSFSITLGKMLQNSATSTDDIQVPYLKAQHVQWGSVRLSDLPTMWASPSEVAALAIRVGDLLVCEGGEVGRAALVSEQPPVNMIIQNALHLVRGRGGAEPRFLAYMLRHAATQGWFDVICNRSTIAHFTVEKFGDMWASLPDASLQRAVADYLDRETGTLDALVAAKQRMLELLAEKRRSLIARAVTRGVNPSVSFRNSGISWLGEIPAHWETRRLAWLFRERDERGEPSLPLLEVSINTGVVLREFFEERIESTAADFNSYKVARKDDVVFNKMRMWQGAVGIAPQDGLVSPDYVVAAPHGALSPRFAGLLFRTAAFSAECARRSHGLVWDRLRLYWDGFRDIEVPLPSLEAQGDIVCFVARETSKLDGLRSATLRTVSLLEERRAALIGAAVTGQINVGAVE
jgi:type I restriction enzyme S subunit